MKTIAKAEVPGLTKAQNSIQIVVLIAVSIITVWTLYMVPSWQVPGDPFLLAAVVVDHLNLHFFERSPEI